MVVVGIKSLQVNDQADGWIVADGYLREACEELPMAQFSYMLGLLLDTIALDHSASRIRTAVHMTRSLLYASPEGSNSQL